MTAAKHPGEAERRTSRRVLLKIPVRIRREDQPEQWQVGETRDVSAAGMLLEADQGFAISAGVVVLFTLAGEQTSRQVKGVITRTELEEAGGRHLVGLKFTEVDAKGREHIAAALRGTDIVALLRQAAESGASDVHLSANHPPLVRVAGKLKPLRQDALEAPELKHMIYTLMDDRQRQAFERDLELNFSFSIEPTIRYRINVHNQRGNVEAAFRRIEPAVRTVQELSLPSIVERFAEFQDGLVLVTGPTGAGKTTTVAAMVDHINRTKAAVVITLENPIEYVYPYKQSVIKQREIGVDTHSFPTALQEAMRQDPDVIVVGEVRDEVTMKTALDAAETGHLVLATFPAADCTQSILRVIHFFRKERQGEAQMQLSNCLRAIMSERLLPRIDAVGVIPATEVLVNTSAIANLIRSGTIEQIPSVIQTSMKQGMHNLDSSLEKLHRGGLIALETVKQHGLNVEEMLRRLQTPGSPEKPKRGNLS